MPDLLNIYTNELNTSSAPTQKAAAFRPGTDEYWVMVCGTYPFGGLYYPGRRFFRSTDGATFNLLVLAGMNLWFPVGGGVDQGLAVAYNQPTSFVFDESGNNLYAVTVTREYTGGTLYHRAYCNRYSFQDDAWYSVYVVELGSVGYLPDIELDSLGNPMMVVFDGTDNYFVYKNESGVTVENTGNPTIGPSSIGRYGGSIFVHSTNGLTGTDSYLYFVPINGATGVPAPLENWNTAEPHRYTINLPHASVVTGVGKLGLLGISSDQLKFRIYNYGGGAGLSDEETVTTDDVQSYGYGLSYRGGIWHALYCLTTQSGVRYSARNEDGVWPFSGVIEGTEASDWNYFGITKQGVNPPQILASAFGCIVIDTVSKEAKFIFLDDWIGGGIPPPEGDNYWEYGTAFETHRFRFNVGTKAAQHYDTLSLPASVVMDVTQIHDTPVFVQNIIYPGYDVGMFFTFTNEFQDWGHPTGEFIDRTMEVATGAIDAGSPYKKVAQGIVIDFLFQHKDVNVVNDMELLVLVTNEKGYSQSFYIDKDSIMKPRRLHLPGRYFIVTLKETSVGDTSIRSIELNGVHTGGRV
jgi:hypothetical protein